MAGLRLLMPRLWQSQIAAGPLAFLVVFLAFHLFNAFFEWFFHRYVLHAVTAPWLRRFATDHRHHHSLTPVRLRPDPNGPGRVVLNEYPIDREEQFPDSAFPFYALAAFYVLFTPLLALFQWLLPHQPVLLGGYAAITWSMVLYEVLHAVDHWPYAWWQRIVEHRRLGHAGRRLYGFHLMHHANVGCNEAIAGFFGIAVADWCFGTYHQPRELLLTGRLATARDFAVPPPGPLVRALDRWARAREARLMRSDAGAALVHDPHHGD